MPLTEQAGPGHVIKGRPQVQEERCEMRGNEPGVLGRHRQLKHSLFARLALLPKMEGPFLIGEPAVAVRLPHSLGEDAAD